MHGRTGERERERNGRSIAKEEIGTFVKEKALINSLIDYVRIYFCLVYLNYYLPITGLLVY